MTSTARMIHDEHWLQREMVRHQGYAAEPDLSPFLGLIVGSELIEGHDARWRYDVVRAVVTTASGITGDGGETFDAYNLAEVGHVAEPVTGVAWYVWGVDVHGDDYQATWSPKPVGGGGTDGTHHTDVAVMLWPFAAADGDVTFLFHAVGSHDGVCA